MVSMASLVSHGHVTQRQAGLFGMVAAAFAAIAHDVPPAAASVMATLFACAVFQVRCDDCLGPEAPAIAHRCSAFAHMVSGGGRRLQQEVLFMREQLGLPPL